jgi:hypothetical protein
MQKGETISIIWIDGGTVSSLFVENLLETVLYSYGTENPVKTWVHCTGPQIHVNRENSIKTWEKEKTDWLLFVDSDVLLTKDVFDCMRHSANYQTRPVMCGIYIQTDMTPSIDVINPVTLGKDEVVPILNSGFGLVLVHKSVIEKLRKKHVSSPIFDVSYQNGDWVGEDTSFFRKCQDLNIPLFANTKAVAGHVKAVPLTLETLKKHYQA